MKPRTNGAPRVCLMGGPPAHLPLACGSWVGHPSAGNYCVPEGANRKWRMAKSKNSWWISGVAINLLSSLIAFAVGGVVTYFEKAGSVWVKPLTFGLLTWLLVSTLFYLFRLGLRLPAKTNLITDDNLEKHLREWMDRYNLTVQRFNDPGLHFSFVVTTIGGRKIAIKRRIDFPEYVTFSADMQALDAEARAIFDGLSADDRIRAMAEVRLEISHAVVGLSIPKTMPDGYSLFRQLPITHALTEAQFIREIWRLEAVVNSIMAVNGLTEIRLRAEGKISERAPVP